MYFKCCQRLAAEGDYHALRELAWCHYLGRGVKKDCINAIELLQDAVANNNLDEEKEQDIRDLISYFSENVWDC